MEIKNDTMISVTNRSAGSLSYTLDELRMKRRFTTGETKDIPFLELKTLYNTYAGKSILNEELCINNKEVVKILEMEVEPEYYYTEDKIKEIMISGTLNEFLDMIDFAPSGVHTIIKNLAVSLPLNDVTKRDAILEKLNFNVTNAIGIQNSNFDDGSEDTTNKPVQQKRRVAAVEEEKPVETTTPKRRVTIKE